MKPWFSISDTEWWVRLPSAIAMAVAIALTGWYAARRSRLRIGVLTVVFATLGVSGISRYAQEARPYPFTVLACVSAVIAWDLAIKRRSRSMATGYAAFLVTAALLHLYSITIVAALTVSAFFIDTEQRWRNIRWTLLPAACAGLCLIPFIGLAAAKAPGPNFYYELDLDSISWVARRLFTNTTGSGNLALWLLLAILLLASIGTFWGLRSYKPLTITCLAWASIPPALLYLAQAATGNPTMLHRYWLFVIPAWCALAGLGLDALMSKSLPLGVVTLIAMILAAAPAQLATRSYYGHSQTSLRALDRALRVPALADLPILYWPAHQYTVMRGYGSDIVASRLPLSKNPDSSGQWFLIEATEQEQIDVALASASAVVLVVANIQSYTDWPAKLKAAGFEDAVVSCRFGASARERQLTIYARGEVGAAPTAAEITRQVQASAPDGDARCGKVPAAAYAP